MVFNRGLLFVAAPQGIQFPLPCSVGGLVAHGRFAADQNLNLMQVSSRLAPSGVTSDLAPYLGAELLVNY